MPSPDRCQSAVMVLPERVPVNEPRARSFSYGLMSICPDARSPVSTSWSVVVSRLRMSRKQSESGCRVDASETVVDEAGRSDLVDDELD